MFPQGLTSPVRTEWRRDAASPAPRLDDVVSPDDGLIGERFARPVTDAERRFVFAVVGSMLFVAVYGQRFTLPAGRIPLAPPRGGRHVGGLLLRGPRRLRRHLGPTGLDLMTAG